MSDYHSTAEGVPSMAPSDAKTAKQMYDSQAKDREPILDRAIDCAEFTLPYIQPPRDHKETDKLKTPYSTVGAEGVNNLASKALTTLFPINEAFFKLTPDEFVMQELEAVERQQVKGGQPTEDETAIRTKIIEALTRLESLIMSKMEKNAWRPKIFHALKLFFCTGNALLHLGDKGKMRVYKLSDYVVQRSGEGEILKIITKEHYDFNALDDTMKELVRSQRKASGEAFDEDALKDLELYTVVTRKNAEGDFEVYQELEGIRVAGSEYEYNENDYPRYIALRHTSIDGEHYGRGRVEEFIGALRSHMGAEEAIVKFGQISADIIPLVDPNSTIDLAQLNERQDGEFLYGKPEDIAYAQAQKSADFNTLFSVYQTLDRQLKKAFLLNSSAQRDGERVTATEWNMMVQELEEGFGGIYTILSQDFQYPLLKALIGQLKNEGNYPDFGDGEQSIEPTIITGVEAISRGHELNNLGKSLEMLQPFWEEISPMVNKRELGKRVFIANKVKLDGLLLPAQVLAQKKAEEQQAMQQMQQQEAMMGGMQASMPQVAGKVVDGAISGDIPPEAIQGAIDQAQNMM